MTQEPSCASTGPGDALWPYQLPFVGRIAGPRLVQGPRADGAVACSVV